MFHHLIRKDPETNFPLNKEKPTKGRSSCFSNANQKPKVNLHDPSNVLATFPEMPTEHLKRCSFHTLSCLIGLYQSEQIQWRKPNSKENKFSLQKKK